MPHQQNKCANPACGCIVEEDAGYCSEYCEDAGETLETSCRCGHAGCGAGEGKTVMTAQS